MTDPIDEYAIQQLREFDGNKFPNVRTDGTGRVRRVLRKKLKLVLYCILLVRVRCRIHRLHERGVGAKEEGW